MRNIKLRYLSILLILGLVSSILLVNSCKNDEIPPDKLPRICFTEEVLPIFQNNCSTSGCHDGNGESKYTFNDFNGIVRSGAVVPGNPDKSPAYQAMISTFQLMPPKNPLSESNRAIIRLWIEQGALETCDTPK
jgi:hypothetical protein